MIVNNKELLTKLSDRLLEKETLDILEIIDILGKRPYPLPENIEHYINEVKLKEKEKKEVKVSDTIPEALTPETIESEKNKLI